MNYIDMHTHTTASDGVYTPSQLIDYAISKKVKAIAITDHDTVGGIEEAINYSKGIQDFFILPGIELSTEYAQEEIHILGYNINYKNRGLLDILSAIQNDREERANKIIHKLKTLDVFITYEEIIDLAKEGAIGRPHIARLLVMKGYTNSVEDAFSKFLNKGAPAYVPRYKLTPFEAMEIIKSAGGFVSIAHPGLIKNKKKLCNLLTKEVDAIEVYHPEHSQIDNNLLLSVAKEHGLMVTGGSDFHAPPENKEKRHGDLGSKKVPFDNIRKIIHNIGSDDSGSN